MAAKTPTQRSLEYMRNLGWTVAVVERSSNFRGVFRRHDLFGIADLMYLADGEAGLVQVTSGSNVSARIKKIADSEHIADIRKAGLRVWVHGWTKGKNGKYTLREVDLS
jgi:hypothetical protein